MRAELTPPKDSLAKTEPDGTAHLSPTFFAALGLAFALALVFRIAWVHYWPLSIESEGVYYARLAQNLLSGRGYVGVKEAGKQLLYPPLYPLLIALFSLVARDAELAGRIVSVTFGSLWIVPMMLIARDLFDEAAGVVTGILALLSPALIAISGTVQSEPVYLACQAAGIYFALRVLRSHPKASCYLAGLSFGLAYLVRPEAAIYVALTALLCLLPGQVRLRLSDVVRFALAFGLTILPYVLWLSVQVGSLRLETKSVENYAEGLRLAQGMPAGAIYFGVDPQLNETGLSNQSELTMIRQTTITSKVLLKLTISNARSNTKQVLSVLVRDWFFGGPLFLLLVAIGALSPAANRAAFVGRCYLFAIFILTFVPLFSLHSFYDRFMFAFMTILFPLSGKGLVRLYELLLRTLNVISSGARRYAKAWTLFAASTAVAYGASCLVVEARSLEDLKAGTLLTMADITVRRGDPLVKTIGRAIKNPDLGHELVMGSSDIAFYADAAAWPLPYCDGHTALRYIAERKEPDYIVLRSGDAHTFPYARQWMDEGIPDARAVLVLTTGSTNLGKVQVYRWRTK